MSRPPQQIGLLMFFFLKIRGIHQRHIYLDLVIISQNQFDVAPHWATQPELAYSQPPSATTLRSHSSQFSLVLGSDIAKSSCPNQEFAADNRRWRWNATIIIIILRFILFNKMGSDCFSSKMGWVGLILFVFNPS